MLVICHQEWLHFLSQQNCLPDNGDSSRQDVEQQMGKKGDF
jgi:hypothetical protein